MFTVFVIFMNVQVTRLGKRQKLYYQDSFTKHTDRGTPFTDRISVNGTGSTGEVVLTINNVQVEDELEFICSVKGLTEGAGEGRTRLKVFGKIQPIFQMTPHVSSFQCYQ